MRFIPPLEISSKIMTLIEEANVELILVSPYVEISKWDKMKKCLERAVHRKVKITFIARKNAKQDLGFIERLGINLVLVNDLHAKLYINENYGIVTSQNIVYYSDINSIDIAYHTENTTQRKELIDYVNKYIVDINPVLKYTFNIVENSNYDGLIQLDAQQLDKMSQLFIRKYDRIKFVITASYIFSGNLLPFGDVMIGSQYIIKIRKDYRDCDKLLEELSKTSFLFKNIFTINLQTSHKKFYYLEFVPSKGFEYSNLLADYNMITEEILENPYVQIISKKLEEMIKKAVWIN